jgi:hypothetical protein
VLAVPETTAVLTPASARNAPDARGLIPVDNLRCAVPQHMGGLGGAPLELSSAISRLCGVSPSAALMFWAQRMAIEFLVQASNVALREYLLPDLLTFQRSATVPFNFAHNSLTVNNDGRHLFLNGGDYITTYASADGFALICPLQSDTEAVGWCVLHSEEQGFDCAPHVIHPAAPHADAARITLRQIFFRGDELWGEAPLHHSVLDVQTALGVIYEALLQDHEAM